MSTQTQRVSSRLSADLVVGLHLAFIAFLVVGGFLTWEWPGVAPAHILALVVSAAIYVGGFDCPLTTLEKHLRTQAGEVVYPEGFIAHYLVAPVRPSGMTARLGSGIVVAVVGITIVAYGRDLAPGLLSGL